MGACHCARSASVAEVGSTPEQLAATLDVAAALVAEVERAVSSPPAHSPHDPEAR